MSPARHLPYFFTEFNPTGSTLELTGRQLQHLKVRRARIGDLLTVGDGAGQVARARIQELAPNLVSAEILSVQFVEPPAVTVSVLQGLAKGSKVDWAVEKLVELGVDEVVVFGGGRSVPVWDAPKKAAALQRWNRVAEAAARQSHRAWLPRIRGPLSLEEAVGGLTGGALVLVGDPEAPAGLRTAISAGVITEVIAVVGPEGGLTPSEVEAFRSAGATAVSLGGQVLRTETAGLAICSVLLYELGRLG